MSDTEAETVMDLGEFIVDLKNSDPEIGQILDDIITEYEHFANREQRKKDVLGGEMLTTRKPKPVVSTGEGGDGQIIKKPIIPGPVAVNQPILPLSQRRVASVSPTGRFNYALRKGGMLIKGKPRLTKKGWK